MKLQELLPESEIDDRRFRANIVIEDLPFVDVDDLIGKVITIGSVKLKVTHKTKRCRMIALKQGGLNYSPKTLKEVSRSFGLNFGCGVELSSN